MPGERSYTSFGTTARELEAAWNDRLLDARHLFEAGRNAMAIAMGVYALEILLKVQICRKLELKSLPRAFEIHDLSGLLIVSGLSKAMNSKRAKPVKSNWGKILKIARDLNVLRYKHNESKSRDEAERFFDQLNDPADGVISWIKAQP